MAEWLRSGLQSRLSRFDSGRGLRGLSRQLGDFASISINFMERQFYMNSELSGDSLIFARFNMVESQLKSGGVRCPRLLRRFLEIPREAFLLGQSCSVPYAEIGFSVSLEVGERLLLTPLSLARLVELADLGADDHVLDIASGTGYSSAIMAGLSNTVISLESYSAFVKNATKAWDSLGVDNVVAFCGDLVAGLSAQAPFDVILINGACDQVPRSLLRQLSRGGRLIAVERGEGGTRAVIYRRRKKSERDGYNRSVAFDIMVPYLDDFAPAPVFEF